MSVHTCTCTYLHTLLGVTLLSTCTCTHIHIPAYTHNYSLSPPVITHLVSNETLVLLPDPPSCLALTCYWQVGRVWGTMLTKSNHKTIKGYPWIRLYTYKLAHTCTSIHTHAQYIHTFILCHITHRYVVIWKKVQSTWYLYIDIFNSNTPPSTQWGGGGEVVNSELYMSRLVYVCLYDGMFSCLPHFGSSCVVMTLDVWVANIEFLIWCDFFLFTPATCWNSKWGLH